MTLFIDRTGKLYETHTGAISGDILEQYPAVLTE